jgi:hypothetical protein
MANRKCCDTAKGAGPHTDGCLNRPGRVVAVTRRQPETLEADPRLKCIVCGRSPAFPTINLCGPCATGEADFGVEP